MQFIKPLTEELSQDLRDSLNSLHRCGCFSCFVDRYRLNSGSELSQIYDKVLKSGDEDINFEKTSEEIRWQLKSFLVCQIDSNVIKDQVTSSASYV